MRDVCNEHESLVVSLARIEETTTNIDRRLERVENTVDSVRERVEGLRGQASARGQAVRWIIGIVAIVATVALGALRLIH